MSLIETLLSTFGALLLGVVSGLALLVGIGLSLAVWFRTTREKNEEQPTVTSATGATTPATKVAPTLTFRRVAGILAVVAVLWIAGSLVNQKIDNPMPYTIALAIGALQYFTGSKKGNLKSAVLLTILAVVLIWFWIHPQVLLGMGSSILEPFVTSDTVSSWGKSDVSLALNVIMIGIVIRALWVTGDFFGMVFIVGAMTIGRMLLGI